MQKKVAKGCTCSNFEFMLIDLVNHGGIGEINKNESNGEEAPEIGNRW